MFEWPYLQFPRIQIQILEKSKKYLKSLTSIPFGGPIDIAFCPTPDAWCIRSSRNLMICKQIGEKAGSCSMKLGQDLGQTLPRCSDICRKWNGARTGDLRPLPNPEIQKIQMLLFFENLTLLEFKLC